jgi:hypothetical protein
VQLAVTASMAAWLRDAGAAAVVALERPLELTICLDDDPRAVAYIIDKAKSSY